MARPGELADVPAEVKAIISNYSNEAKLALLERRFTVPPSPAASREDTRATSLLNQNSVHSCGSARVQNTPTVSGRSKHTLDAGDSQDGAAAVNQQPAKRRRVAQQPLAVQPQPQPQQQQLGVKRGVSPPSMGQLPRPSLSPFLAAAQQQQQQQQPALQSRLTPNSKQKQRNSISRYFPMVANGEAPAPAPAATKVAAASPPQQPAPQAVVDPALEEEARTLREENQRLQFELAKVQVEKERAQSSLAQLEMEQSESKRQWQQREGAVRCALLQLVTTVAKHEREEAVQRLQQAAPRMGGLGVRRKGLDVQEVWEDGQAFKDLQCRMASIAEQRENIETARKAAKRRLPLPGQSVPEKGAGASDTAAGGIAGTLHPDDWLVQEELYKARLAALKREEDMVRQEAARLEAEKMTYIRELKRVKDEEGSRFGGHPVMANRYLLMNLLGRGGFSEVYKAFDLVTLREVACKIHQLSSQWSESKKASYVKHSVREYNIQKKLNHPRIVSLLDIFEIDNNTFATVLELCQGGDLDSYLKLHETLPEKEAKAIVAQVLAGLLYLQAPANRIIHYDLKPANILFDKNGETKITDFGLSKIQEEGQSQGMELTSQGAGTYWYLPPETFETSRKPMITNKVDVWSVGVIFYQMLFGRRPFGHDQSQEQILRNEVMLNAREVQFPSKPVLSPEGKEFIRNCLAYRAEERFDVAQAAASPYLSFKKERKTKENAAANPTA